MNKQMQIHKKNKNSTVPSESATLLNAVSIVYIYLGEASNVIRLY